MTALCLVWKSECGYLLQSFRTSSFPLRLDVGAHRSSLFFFMAIWYSTLSPWQICWWFFFFAWSLVYFFFKQNCSACSRKGLCKHARVSAGFSCRNPCGRTGCVPIFMPANLPIISWVWANVHCWIPHRAVCFLLPFTGELIRDILLFILSSFLVNKDLNHSFKFLCPSSSRLRLTVHVWRWAWWTPSV